MNQFDECFVLYSENIRIHQEKLGHQHAQTLRSLSRLANTYFAAGRYQDAKPMFENILARRVEVLGRDHPDTLRSRSSLANTFAALGEYVAAAKLHEEIIKDRVRVLGSNHLRTELSRKRLETARRAGQNA
jgi:tetratricopeptide (TPR) repeat protein